MRGAVGMTSSTITSRAAALPPLVVPRGSLI
jgi:hypothetical protein